MFTASQSVFAIRLRHTADPMKPAPPVTINLTRHLFVERHRRLRFNRRGGLREGHNTRRNGPSTSHGGRRNLLAFTQLELILRHFQKIAAIGCLLERSGRGTKLSRVKEATAKSDFLRAADLQPLTFLHGLDELCGLEQRGRSSCVKPGIAAAQPLNPERFPLQNT